LPLCMLRYRLDDGEGRRLITMADDLVERLERLSKLKEAGALSESEFTKAKEQLLNPGPPAASATAAAGSAPGAGDEAMELDGEERAASVRQVGVRRPRCFCSPVSLCARARACNPGCPPLRSGRSACVWKCRSPAAAAPMLKDVILLRLLQLRERRRATNTKRRGAAARSTRPAGAAAPELAAGLSSPNSSVGLSGGAGPRPAEPRLPTLPAQFTSPPVRPWTFKRGMSVCLVAIASFSFTLRILQGVRLVLSCGEVDFAEVRAQRLALSLAFV
jgi:hypothetical protein